eukprot:589063-Rhodomonas_salina.1
MQRVEPYLTMGYIHWDDFQTVLASGRCGEYGAVHDVGVTPGSKKSQFGSIVKWVPCFASLTPQWWSENIMPLQPK